MGRERRTEEFERRVARKAERRLRSRRGESDPLFFGLGAFGTVGWAVVVPALIGLAVGVWLDARLIGPVPWTLVGLATGLAVGCVTAWRWLAAGSRENGS